MYALGHLRHAIILYFIYTAMSLQILFVHSKLSVVWCECMNVFLHPWCITLIVKLGGVEVSQGVYECGSDILLKSRLMALLFCFLCLILRLVGASTVTNAK